MLLNIAASVHFSSVAQSCPALCDPMNRSMPGLPVHHHLPSWQLDGGKWKHGHILLSWTPKSLWTVTCSHEIKRHLLVGNKSYDKLRQRIKKQRHHFADKGPPSQSYGFSSSHVWTWELDYKETEHLKINAFELWCWRRLLRILWTARRSNQSIVKEINSSFLSVYAQQWECWVIRQFYFQCFKESPHCSP